MVVVYDKKKNDAYLCYDLCVIGRSKIVWRHGSNGTYKFHMTETTKR